MKVMKMFPLQVHLTITLIRYDFISDMILSVGYFRNHLKVSPFAIVLEEEKNC